MKNISLSIPAALILIILSLLPHPLHAAAGDTLRVLYPDVHVRERPDVDSPAILKVQKDSVVTELSRLGEWVLVQVPGYDRQGWIRAKLLTQVTERPLPAREKAQALQAKSVTPSSKSVTASESSPQPKGAPMTTAAGSPLPKQPVTKVGDTLRVLYPNVHVRERPDIDSPAILKVQKDSVVTELSRSGEWVLVEVPGNDRQGWIRAKLLAQVTERPVPVGEKVLTLPAKGDAPPSKSVAASESSPQHKGATAEGSPLPKQPVTKIGVVYLQRIINESVDGKKAKKNFAELAASTPAEDLKKLEQRLIRQIVEKIETIIAQYARKEGFTHVVDAPESGFLFADERFDITDPIIKLYDQKSAADAVERPRAEKPAGSEVPRPAGGSLR